MPTLPPVVFEDDVIIAFDKPSGLLIAPDRWDKSRENLMDLVHDRMGHGVANVHRIDADTSGLVLCAKTKPALMSRTFSVTLGRMAMSPASSALPSSDARKASALLVALRNGTHWYQLPFSPAGFRPIWVNWLTT